MIFLAILTLHIIGAALSVTYILSAMIVAYKKSGSLRLLKNSGIILVAHQAVSGISLVILSDVPPSLSQICVSGTAYVVVITCAYVLARNRITFSHL